MKNNPIPKFERFTEKGGEDYTELVFKLKNNESFPIEIAEDFKTIDKIKTSMDYESPGSHFGMKNEFAHVRFKTRTNESGRKILSVEEMQSDISNRIKGQNSRSTGQSVVTDYPFKNNWYEFVIKRLIRHAADNGFDAISIPKGSVLADRYGELRKLKDFSIGSYDLKRNQVGFEANDTFGMLQISDNFTHDNLKKEYPKFADEVIFLTQELEKTKGMSREASKEFLEELNEKSDTFVIDILITLDEYYDVPRNGISGLRFNAKEPIELGGEGKKEFYDQIVPSYLKKYGKKWNAKVYDDQVNTREIFVNNKGFRKSNQFEKMPVTTIDITPEMKQGVQSKSQPLFELFGGVSLSTFGAKSVSDSIENNIISDQTN